MIISNITKERVWCRTTEEKILKAWMEGKKLKSQKEILLFVETLVKSINYGIQSLYLKIWRQKK